MRQWQRQNRVGAPPYAVKEMVLKEYADRFSLVRFIETGTFMGDMVCAMRCVMEEIWSIELDHSLCEHAKRKFRRFQNIHILEGDSAKLLGTILASIQEPCLFWLDAHYSGGVTAYGKQESPIIQELDHVLHHNVFGHVVLIDDARCFTGDNAYPTIAELESLIQRHRPEWRFTVAHDIIRLTPAKKHFSVT